MKKIMVLLAVIFSACEEYISVDIVPKDNKIVIDGFISDSVGYNYVKLYKIQDYNADYSDSISNANVAIYSELDTTYFNENPEKKGCYENNLFKGSAGLNYHLTVTIDDQKYEAVAHLLEPKDPFILEQVNVNEIEVQYTNDSLWYRYVTYINDTLKTGIGWFWVIPMYNYFGEDFPITYPLALNDKVKVERQSLDSTCHDYFMQLYKYLQVVPNPYVNPQEFPRGNISNGAEGIFRASSISIEEIVLTK